MSILENVKYEHIAILILFVITMVNLVLLLINNKKVKKLKIGTWLFEYFVV